MAILAGLAGILGRFAGRLLNTTLGWATMLLFGKVPQRNQTILLLIVLGSLGWVALVAGVLVPDVGALLIAAVPLPDFIEESWVRLAMLAGAIVLPLVIGVAAVFIADAKDRPKGAGLLKAVLRGYPFTLALALTIVILAGVATFRRLRALAKRWEDTHVPVIVKPGAYEAVLGELHSVLTAAGLELMVKPAPRLVSAPPRLLDAAAGHALGALVPDRLMLLASPELEVLVYPSDLAISGKKQKVARARAAIVSRLTHAPAYLTTSAEAQQFEDRIERTQSAAGPEAGLRAVARLDDQLAALVVPFDEWETLYRERLQVERDFLRGAGAETGAQTAGARPSSRSRMTTVVALGGLALVALDVALLLARRARGHDPAEDTADT